MREMELEDISAERTAALIACIEPLVLQSQ